jgi:signal transduction histidine kinase
MAIMAILADVEPGLPARRKGLGKGLRFVNPESAPRSHPLSGRQDAALNGRQGCPPPHFRQGLRKGSVLFLNFFLYLLIGGCSCQVSFAQELEQSRELHTASAIRGLTVEEAREQRPVRLRGVVTFFDEVLFSRFIQDDTAGVYLLDNALPVHFNPGDLVEVQGESHPGDYAPIVIPHRIEKVGEAPMPSAKLVTYDQLASGVEDSQFIETTGLVRSVELQESSQVYLVEIVTGGGRLSVYTRQLPLTIPDEMLDSVVRVRGVCSTQFNRQRQLFATRILVPRSEDLVVLEPGAKDPFSAPLRPIGSLLQFNPHESIGHRVRVSGTVIHQEEGRMLLLQDGDQGVEVQTHLRNILSAGDRVEALGYVSKGDYTPILQDAVYRKVASGEPIVPSRISHDEALKGKHDCRLVQITAEILGRSVNENESHLLLQENGFIFHAYLGQTKGRDAFEGYDNGSLVSVIGVCRIEPGDWMAGDDWRAKSFRLQMRTTRDVTLLQSPSWWTLSRVLRVAVAIGVAALGAFAYVVVLRRQVTERTLQLESQIQRRQIAERRHLIEQERTRVAQDLHDELGSSLTEVGMLGTLARTPSLPLAERDRYLDKLTASAREVVSILDEIVWAVNPKYDSLASLASYYSLFAQRFLNLAGIACRLRVAEEFPLAPLDSRKRHGVFLAFKEALNNAVRHSSATQVIVEMEMVERQLRIVVADNGIGFVFAEGTPGHDGLTGMTSRLVKLGGRCEIVSGAGKGTRVEFWLPLDEDLQ